MRKPASTRWVYESNKVVDEEVALREQWHDPETGVAIHRLTSLPVVHTNIYPEALISSPDGRRFIFQRTDPGTQRSTFWMADIERLAIRQITDEPGADAPIYHPEGRWIYYFVGSSIRRMCAETFEREEVFRIPNTWGATNYHAPSMACRGTQFLVGHYDPKRRLRGVMVIDLEKRSRTIAYQHKELWNPHAQFSRNPDCKILVQVNHGMQFDADGNYTRLVSGNGASLHVVNADGTGHVQLSVGGSPVERVQGHQCWVGRCDAVITTLHRRSSPKAAWVQDRIVIIRPGDTQYRIVGKGPGFTHIHTDPRGRYWVSDCNRTARIYVGSIRTGRHRLFCSTGATFGAAQYGHPHPFFLGDGNTIGWNSDASGIPHVYCARIPKGFLDSLG